MLIYCCPSAPATRPTNTAAATPRVVNAGLQTFPGESGVFTRPVRQLNTTLATGTLDIVAE